MICWVCYESIYFRTDRCQCVGDISFIHNKCLDEYIMMSKQSICRFCKTKYHYSVTKYVISRLIDMWQSMVYITLLMHGFEMGSDIEDDYSI